MLFRIKIFLFHNTISTLFSYHTAPESFNHRKFFQICGLSKKTPEEVKNVFEIIDEDGSGSIDEDELKFFLQKFSPGARLLSETEIKSILTAADDDSDGQIGADGEYAYIP
ncbi:hypothetical protein P4O66_007670 [Electrophorus voltai]|uniref:Parvalbumin n=1 Tax=Electrophorus voltai TaxID=2609070 RepID=A0AAD8ZL47_9TELE|nr:hypothetical protein P4O66_007670 [Electrophorus voltai]